MRLGVDTNEPNGDSSAGGFLFKLSQRLTRPWFLSSPFERPDQFKPVSFWSSLGISLLSLAVCLAFRLLFDHWLGNRFPYLLFYPAVIVASWIGGFRVGLITTLLGILLGEATLRVLDDLAGLEPFELGIRRYGFLTLGLTANVLGQWVASLSRRAGDYLASLRASEDRLVQALAGSHDSLWDLDLLTGRIYRSDRWMELRGHAPHEIGQEQDDWLAFVHPDDADAARESFNQHLEGRTPFYRQEYRIVCKDGQLKWILDRGKTVRDDSGRPIRFLGFETDITETKEIQLAFEKTRKQFEAIVSSAMDAIISVDASASIIVFNAAAGTMFGVEPSEAIGRSIRTFIPTYRIEQATRSESDSPDTDRATARQPLPTTVITGVRRDGREFPIEASFSQVESSGGTLFTVIARDISARRRSEILLAGQALALERLTRGIPLPEVLDHVCRMVEELLPGSLCSILTRQPDGLLRTKAAPSLPTEYTAVINAGVPIGPGIGCCGTAVHEKRMVVASDIASDPFWEDYAELAHQFGLRSCWSCPIIGSSEEAIGSFAIYARENREPDREAIGLIQHIAHLVATAIESTRSREDLKRSEERNRLALEAGHLGTWQHDLSSIHVFYDERSQVIGGITSPHITVEETLNRVHPDDREMVRQAVLDALNPNTSNGRYAVEERIILPDGSIRWIASLAKVFFEGTGANRRPVQAVGVMQDITERKLTEVALRENDRRKDEFLAMLAHELRNPLAAISGAANLLQLKQFDDPDLVWSRDVISWQSNHLNRLIDDLLDVSRITRGKIALRKQTIDIRSTIKRAVEVIVPTVSQKRQSLSVRLPEEPLLGDVDPARLQQILGNLLTNATKYTDEGGRISVSARGEAGEIVIEVADNGIGISSDFLPEIFDLFTQWDASLDRSQGGLGIGLTLVKRLVSLHGGTISAMSDGPGKGSTFTARLPANGHPIVLEAKPESAPQTLPGVDEPDPVVRRILVVDDSRDTAAGLARLFERSGFNVRCAHDGLDAIRVAHEFQPEILLIDIGLPNLDGYQVAKTLRSHPAFRAARMIAISGYGQERDRERSIEAGFDHHVTKPFPFSYLQALVTEPRPLDSAPLPM